MFQHIFFVKTGMMFGLETFVAILTPKSISVTQSTTANFGISGHLKNSRIQIRANVTLYICMCKQYAFLCYSWHEIGYYDIPALIDYILDKTGHAKLYYIGYSQGTTVFYVMGSERPEYSDKVKGMISLAPIAYLENQRSPLFKCLVYFYRLLKVMHFCCRIS